MPVFFSITTRFPSKVIVKIKFWIIVGLVIESKSCFQLIIPPVVSIEKKPFLLFEIYKFWLSKTKSELDTENEPAWTAVSWVGVCHLNSPSEISTAVMSPTLFIKITLSGVTTRDNLFFDWIKKLSVLTSQFSLPSSTEIDLRILSESIR